MKKTEENNSYTKKNIIAWLIISVFFSYQYLIRILPNILTEDIINNLSINGKLYGQLLGVYYISYTAMHIPLGLLYDKLGIRKVISSCILITVLGTALLVHTNSFWIALVARFITGLGSAAATIGVFQIIIMTFPKNKFSLFFGISVVIGLSGAMYAGTPMTNNIKTFGMCNCINTLLLLGLIIMFLSVFFTPNNKNTSLKEKSNIIQEFKIFKKYPMIIILAVIGGLLVAPLEGFADAWANTFYKYKFYGNNISNSESYSLATTVLFIGFMLGSFLMGYIVSKIPKKCLYLILLCSIMMIILFSIILYVDISMPLLITCNFMLGLSCSYQCLIIHKVSEISPKEISGLSTATANMIIMIFGYFFHSTIGFLVEKNNILGLSKSGLQSSFKIILYGLVLGTALQIIIIWKNNKKLK